MSRVPSQTIPILASPISAALAVGLLEPGRIYRYARKGALIVGFNICYDLARLATKWPPGDENEWSLVLSEYPDGNEKLTHPRVLIEPLDRKKAFIRFRAEWVPKKGKVKRTDIGKAGFLDLRTLLWAEFHKSMSLKSACELKAFESITCPKKMTTPRRER